MNVLEARVRGTEKLPFEQAGFIMGCDYFPYFSGSGNFFSGSVLSLILWTFILLIAVLLAVALFRFLRPRDAGFNRDREDSLDILKARYARGEIDRAQYLKIKNTLFPP